MELTPLLGVTTGLLAVLLVLAAKYWFKVRNNHYWKDKNIPCITPIPIFGNYLGLLGSTFYQMDLGWYKKKGRIFGAYESGTPVIYVTDPELLRRIFVKDFHIFHSRRNFTPNDKVVTLMVQHLSGDDWKRVRSVITPAFSTGKLKKMIYLLRECAETTTNNLLEAAEKGSIISARPMFGAFVMDAIASIAFGTKLDSAKHPENAFSTNVSKILNRDYPWKFLVAYLFPSLLKFLRLKPFPSDVTQFFVEFTQLVIQNRKKTKEVRPDLLQALLDAQSNTTGEGFSIEDDLEDSQKPGEPDTDSFFKEYSKNKKISTAEFVSQCVMFFFNGYDSTAVCLSMVSYFLALNPDCQEKLQEEIDRLWTKHNGICYESMTEAKYMDAVISETLRMAPLGTRLERVASEDYPLGDTGIIVPKGMPVLISVYSLQQDPEFYPNPLQFDPDRFLPGNRDKIAPFTYLPFGDGPRHCMGMRLAKFQLQAAIFSIFRHVTFHRCKETQVPLQFFKGSFQFQPKNISLKVQKREIK